MPTDTTGSSGRDDPRRPVIIDLPAEEVGRKPSGKTDPVSAENIALSVDHDDALNRDAHAESSPGSEDTRLAGDDVEMPPWSPPPPGPGTESPLEDPPHVAPASLTSAKNGSSFGALLGAALLGGAIAAGGLYALDRSGVLPLGPQAENGAQGLDVAAEVARLETEIAELRQAGAAAGQPVDIAPVREQIAALEQSIAELRQQPAGTPADGPALQEVQNRLAQLEESAAALQSAPPGSPDPAIEARLTELSGQVDALRNAPGAADAGPQLADLGRRLDEVAGRVGAVEARPPVDISGLQGTVTQLREDQERLSGRLDAAPTEERVAAVEANLNETRRQAELAAALGPAVAADALGSALQSGAPFVNELAALRTLGLDEAALAALEPHAERGLPTLAALRSDFEAKVADIDLSVPVPASAGTLDRLVQSARSLVEVRPAGPIAGSDPAAVIARVRAGLEAGDLKAALAEWSALPDELKNPTADWARSVEARAAAENVVARLRSEALSRLGTQG